VSGHENTKTRNPNLILFRGFVLSWLILASGVDPALAQVTRLAVLQAEDRRAPTASDMAILRSGAHSGDPQTTRLAVRALGRLERPALILDITPLLKSALPEIRAEAANAIGQAAQGWRGDQQAPAAALDAAVAALVARLKVEAEPDVRAAICETIGRLPYATAAQVENAERTLLDVAARSEAIGDRLGVAQGFEALVRIHRKLRPPSGDAIALLRRMASPGASEAVTGARVRRLALEALASSGGIGEETLLTVAGDQDAQVRRLAMRAAVTPPRPPSPAEDELLARGLGDPSPVVRLEALRSEGIRHADTAGVCPFAIVAATDPDTHVALSAFDLLSRCGSSPDAVALLVHEVDDLSHAGSPRAWHRAAHALVALSAASAERGTAAIAQFKESRIWQLRMYAARAAATLKDRELLDALARDEDDNVREAAIEGLRKVAGHAADTIYVAQLTRSGNQVLRVSALALEGTPGPDEAVSPLKAAWQRLVAEGKDNSHDARDAIAKTLAGVGADPRGQTPKRAGAAKTGSDPVSSPTSTNRGQTPHNDLNTDDLRRLAAPRARVTIRGVGSFELALFTAQAPATVLRFARLAESGYYNGLSFHRVVPNFVIQGGSPGANEYVGDATFMRDEVGTWPHVRGAVGISTRGHDTGDAQIFVDLVDNPRLDHDYTVFAQVLNGIEVVDQILEGDVIDRIEILRGP
jgi:cyclophilin family peptidyl-prolyl cis-trans isomerase/HEAT repeat protein